MFLTAKPLDQASEKRWWTDEYRDTVERIRAEVARQYTGHEPPVYEKIYFTRTRLHDPRDHNERSVERLFEQAGFKVIAPETLSPRRQIWLLMHCREYAATSGSVCHSAMFCLPGTRLIDIRKEELWNSYQVMVNSLAALDVVPLHAHRSTLTSPFYIYPTREVLRFLGRPQSQYRTPLLRLSYIAYLIDHGLRRIVRKTLVAIKLRGC